jgi:hypothetical protein
MRRVKKIAPTHGGDLFGLALGGGCLLTLFDLLFGIRLKIVAVSPDNHLGR